LQLKHLLQKDDMVVILLHDSGSRYVAKVYNDDWMIERGFLKKDIRALHLVEKHKDKNLITAQVDDSVQSVIDKMKKFDISQIPILQGDTIVGSVSDSTLFKAMLDNAELRSEKVSTCMQKAFPTVDYSEKIEEISKLITKDNPAVLTADKNGNFHIITIQDIISAIN
jgi:cystathionine beta-synthase